VQGVRRTARPNRKTAPRGRFVLARRMFRVPYNLYERLNMSTKLT
jgi:hypothetical protein